jgi:hypothetical protein
MKQQQRKENWVMAKSEKKAKEIKKVPLKDLKVKKDVKGGAACFCMGMGQAVRKK